MAAALAAVAITTATVGAMAVEPGRLAIGFQDARFVIADAPLPSTAPALVASTAEVGAERAGAREVADPRVLATVFFAPDDADVAAAYRPRLHAIAQSQAQSLAASGDTVRVIGHADPSGNPDTHLRLSRERALAVRQTLIDAGLAEASIRVLARGASEPACADLASHSLSACLARSRRVEVVAP